MGECECVRVTVCVTLSCSISVNHPSSYLPAHSYSSYDLLSFRQVCALGRCCEGDCVEQIQILAHVQGETCVCVWGEEGVHVGVGI